MRAKNTGSTVPAWIRERTALYEGAWPGWVLAVALVLTTAAVLFLGVELWTSDAVDIYARP